MKHLANVPIGRLIAPLQMTAAAVACMRPLDKPDVTLVGETVEAIERTAKAIGASDQYIEQLAYFCGGPICGCPFVVHAPVAGRLAALGISEFTGAKITFQERETLFEPLYTRAPDRQPVKYNENRNAQHNLCRTSTASTWKICTTRHA